MGDSTSSIPVGFCQCGCGGKTAIAKRTYTKKQIHRGQPLRFLIGHHHHDSTRIYPSRISDGQFISLKARYENGESPQSIADDYKVSLQTIHNQLRKHGVKMRTRNEAMRRYTCDHTFFSDINTEEKAYWLGFMAADGTVYEGKRKYAAIALQPSDHDHLARFRNALSSDFRIYERNRTKSPYHALYIRSHQIVDDLIAQGVVPRKTFKLRWPTSIREDLLRHYLRGYFDADGSFPKTKANCYRPAFALVCNRHFAPECQGWLANTLGLRRLGIRAVDKGQPDTVSFIYCSVKDVKKISCLLYRDATIFMSRKRERVEHLLN